MKRCIDFSSSCCCSESIVSQNWKILIFFMMINEYIYLKDFFPVLIYDEIFIQFLGFDFLFHVNITEIVSLLSREMGVRGYHYVSILVILDVKTAKVTPALRRS